MSIALLLEGMKRKGKKGSPDDELRKLLRGDHRPSNTSDSSGEDESQEEDMNEEADEDPVDLFLEAIGAPVNNNTRKAFKLAAKSCQGSYDNEEELANMPATVTQSSLRGRIRTVVRQPNSSGFISDNELNILINDAAYTLYDLLIQARGELYYSKEWAFNTVVDKRLYTLPTTFYRLIGVVISPTPGALVTVEGEVPLTLGAENEVTPARGSQWIELRVMHPANWALQDSRYGGGYTALQYSLTGRGNEGSNLQRAQLALYPVPSGIYCINMRYIPTLDLSNDSITGAPVYDGINGWEEHIVYSVASTVAAMQEDSNDLWLRKKAEIEARIKALAFNRDRSQPMQVADRWVDADMMSPWWGIPR